MNNENFFVQLESLVLPRVMGSSMRKVRVQWLCYLNGPS